MFKVRVKGSFSAAHSISGYPGDCARLHGHNWDIVATLASGNLDELGMACDFREARRILKKVLEHLDHIVLNEHPWFSDCNPTSERLAANIYNEMSKTLPAGTELLSIEVFESKDSSVEFIP